MQAVRALRQLHESSHSCLTDLSISVLPCPELLEVLLAASPKLTSMHVEIQAVWASQGFSPCPDWTTEAGAAKLLGDVFPESDLNLPPADLPLKVLTVKVGGSPTEAGLIPRVLRRAPSLASFQLCGLRLAAGCSQATLLTTLSGTVRDLLHVSVRDLLNHRISTCQSPTLSYGVSSWRT